MVTIGDDLDADRAARALSKLFGRVGGARLLVYFVGTFMQDVLNDSNARSARTFRIGWRGKQIARLVPPRGGVTFRPVRFAANMDARRWTNGE
jgi:hypothetical protein